MLNCRCTGKKSTSECEQEAVAYLILPLILSAQLTTKNKFSFKYGKIEVRAKLPKGDWLYPGKLNDNYCSSLISTVNSNENNIIYLTDRIARVIRKDCMILTFFRYTLFLTLSFKKFYLEN